MEKGGIEIEGAGAGERQSNRERDMEKGGIEIEGAGAGERQSNRERDMEKGGIEIEGGSDRERWGREMTKEEEAVFRNTHRKEEKIRKSGETEKTKK